MVHRRLVLFALLSVTCPSARAQSPDPIFQDGFESVFSSSGTEFFLTLPDHICVSRPTICPDTPTVRLRIAAKNATSGQVTFAGVTTPFAVARGGEAVVALPTTAVLTSNETVEPKAIHVTALAPVSVIAVVESTGASDGYLALPAGRLGTEYLVVSRSDPDIPGSVFAIAAAEDVTTVTINPTAAGSTMPPGTPFDVMLNAGQTYQFENPASADLTGTQVSADKPIAVFAGHPCARLPTNVGYCEYLVEQLPDLGRLGQTHHLTPFSGRERYTVRILGTVDGTTLQYSPPFAGAPSTLDRGQYADFLATAPLEIFSAPHPVLVVQFMRGLLDDLNPTGGDPSMVTITPAEQGVSEANFSVHDLLGASGTALLNIVTATSAAPALTLDGAPFVGPFSPIGTTGYSAASEVISVGPHVLRGAAPFTGIVYDYGPSAGGATAYSHPLPRDLALMPALVAREEGKRLEAAALLPSELR
jgi:hypothetical protein